MDPVTLATVAGAVAAGISAGVAWHLGFQANKSAKAQYRLAVAARASDWLRDFRHWASDAVDALSKAAYACDTGCCGVDALADCAARLSAVIDRGRFFLPNIDEPLIGKGKPPAYRGYRHHLLDSLVAAERVLTGKAPPGPHGTQSEAIVAMQRIFVSGVQQVLAPAHHNKEIAALIHEMNEARASDPTMGGLLPTPGTIPSGAENLLSTRMEPTPPRRLRS